MYQPAHDIDQLEKDLVEAIQNAADASIPVVAPTSHQHKYNRYYCPEIKELNAQMNRVRKIFRRNPNEENYELLKEVSIHVSTERDAIHHDKGRAGIWKVFLAKKTLLYFFFFFVLKVFLWPSRIP